MRAADHDMPADILAYRGCIRGFPGDFAGLDSLASQILPFERRCNAAATRSAGNSPGPISTSN